MTRWSPPSTGSLARPVRPARPAWSLGPTSMKHLPQEIIRRKRDGGTLEAEHIHAFIEGLTSGTVSEGQAASFAMAIFFRGLSVPERVALTRAMMNSGT